MGAAAVSLTFKSSVMLSVGHSNNSGTGLVAFMARMEVKHSGGGLLFFFQCSSSMATEYSVRKPNMLIRCCSPKQS